MSVRTYDPGRVSVSIGGANISGFADGEFINITQDNDSFSKVSGSDGIVSRSKSNDKTGTLVLTLAQTSPSNDILTGFLTVDELTNEGIVPIIVKDNTGRTIVFTANGWVRKPSDVAFGKEISNREWTIDLADVSFFIGGNADFEPPA